MSSMNTQAQSTRFVLGTLLLALASCSSRARVADGSSVIAAVEPLELAQLNVLLGTWDGVTRSTVIESGEVFEVRSVHHVHWEADGQFLVERTATGAEGGKPTTSICVWTWDDSLGAFRSWRFDSHGTVHERVMHWSDEQEAWLMEMTSKQRGEPELSLARGIMRFTSDEEKTYEWTRFRPGSTEPWVQIEGKSKRISRD